MTHPRLLAVAVMLLGLVSNANAQGPGFPVAVGVGQNPTGAALVLYYPYNEEIAPLTLPMATGGTAPLTYSLPILSNLRFDPATRVLTGVPNVAGGGYFTPDGFPFTYTVTDGAGLTDTVNVHLNVCESGGDDTGTTICTLPSFTPYSIAPRPTNMTYTVNAPINVTLPAATGGTGIEPFRRYALLGLGAGGALPAGLTFDTTSRVLSGTPSAVGNTTVRYRVGEVAGFNPEERAAYFDFTLIVEADSNPVFTPDAAILRPELLPRPDARHDPAIGHRRQWRHHLHADRAGRRGVGPGAARGNLEPDHPRPVRHADRHPRRGKGLHLHGDGRGERRRHADLQHHGVCGQRPDLHRRRDHRRPALHRWREVPPDPAEQ